MNPLVQGQDYIVYHFDGNNNDRDDISALPVTASLANAAGLEKKSFMFYNNNLSEKNNNAQVQDMRESAAFAEKLGIKTFDYQQNTNATTDKLVQIFNSGKKVLSIEGGPMEAVYRALEQTSPENLKNITLLSHSSWNENRNVINRPGIKETRTWSDLKKDFPQINYVDIGDQNGRGDSGFQSKKWNWLDNTNNPIFKEMRSRMRDSGYAVNDPSDAGMLFYAITGKEFGDPNDAKDYFAKNPPSFTNNTGGGLPPTDPKPPTGENPLVIEAEDMQLSGGYRVEKVNAASGGEVISLLGGNNNDTGTAKFDFTGDTGTYDLKISYFDENDGVGQLKINQDGKQLKSFKLDKDLGSPLANEQTKTFMEIKDVSVSKGDVFQIQGIEQGSPKTAEHARVDKIEFIPNSDNSNNGGGNPPTNPKPPVNSSSMLIEAEDMKLSGEYRVEKINAASGGEVISLRGGNNNDTGAATFDFTGATGTYDLKINYFDENDGVGSLKVEKGNQQLISFKLDKQLGSPLANDQTMTSMEISDVFISSGDSFRVEGIEQGSPLTAEHTRIDSIEIIPNHSSSAMV
ncbi:carbohydrate-binding protein [Mastigocoleus testarum]|uniref:CBM6 domain-containing protein n=1 Tax=Mastigocoleus testarum BC008 TaxID=371196 RepID=A0A0V7ZT89_9CYAN|nr:hypothetical protein [Mastigocoleus testarum]KST67690.1 hypothetical protein BC008_43825 [Mastigocoleus testarum BC008]